ncbi:probable 39S ribosomal protein L24, mitochondrial [Oppia nitens]|uniref:probable 39S ribosomal protein L24, mitochondrial n=1 Tax=Oppia nitens TaxID=1686743 RepID=UPI0023DC2306|nr:probable 39S ribosomal protein L24, mitochondrial [Oppia nitens]
MRLTVRLLASYSKLPKRFSNFPERYVKKQTEFIEWRTPRLINYNPRTVRWRKRAYYDMSRPWTDEFQQLNAPNVDIPTIFVEPIKKFYIFRGDRVEILVGKDKGKHGIVNYVVNERNWVCVEGLNLKFEYQSRDDNYYGALLSIEQPLLVPRDVALVDPSDHKPTKIEWRFDEEGNEVRVSTRTGRIIPIPGLAEETRDYKTPTTYLEQDKDTRPDQLKKTTFVPKVKTFEMDIMDDMAIEDDRVPYPMFWY